MKTLKKFFIYVISDIVKGVLTKLRFMDTKKSLEKHSSPILVCVVGWWAFIDGWPGHLNDKATPSYAPYTLLLQILDTFCETNVNETVPPEELVRTKVAN